MAVARWPPPHPTPTNPAPAATPQGRGLAESGAPPALSCPLSGEKDDLLASPRDWKLISRFPHAFCFQFEAWQTRLFSRWSSGRAARRLDPKGRAVGGPASRDPGRFPFGAGDRGREFKVWSWFWVFLVWFPLRGALCSQEGSPLAAVFHWGSPCRAALGSHFCE